MTAAAGPTDLKALSASNALERLTTLVAEDLQAVNQTIMDRMASPVALIPQLASYIVASGGKRLRPMLTLASARLCGHVGDRHIGLAASVELLHTATLLHDDVVDESDLRRGKASANDVFGNQASVLVGDFLFARAFQLMVDNGSLDVLRIMSAASAKIVEGEVLQLTAINDAETTEETYLQIIQSKTAALFDAACRIGAVVADRSAEDEDALGEFGTQLGIAFQLVDDVLDYSARQARLGKTVGDDFQDGKFTLPVVLAYARGDETEREFWRRTLVDQKTGDGDLDQAIALLDSHDALADTVARAQAAGAKAKASLDRFPDGVLRQTLLETVDFCVSRDF